MQIRDSVAFITGANRGIGLAFAQELLAAGARKVYAAARNPESITLDGVHRVRLDMTEFGGIAPKVEPADVVRQVLSAIEAGRDEVLADDMTRQSKPGYPMNRAFT